MAGEGVAAGAEAEGVMRIRCSAFEISRLTAAVCKAKNLVCAII